MTNGGSDGDTRPARKGELAGLALSMLLGSMGLSIANVALPSLAEAFAVPIAEVQWVVLAYLLALSVATVPVGHLGDTFGHGRMLLVGLALFTIGAAGSGLALQLSHLVIARGVQGLGAAFLITLTISKVRTVVTPGRTGRTMGLLGTMSAVGTALGPSLGGLSIAGFGWRGVFACLIPFCLGALVFGLRSGWAAPQPQRRSGTNFDGWGVLALTTALTLYAVAMTSPDGFDSGNYAALFFACLAAALFVFIETRAAAPLIRFSMFRSAAFSASFAINAVVSATMMAMLVVGPFYLAFGLGLGEAAVGLVMAAGPVAGAFAGAPAGRATDRYGVRVTICSGLTIMTLGALGLACLGALLGVGGYILGLLMLVPGYQLFQVANNAAVMAEAESADRGAASGLLGLSRNIGFITGASLIGTIFAAATGNADVAAAAPTAITFGLAVTFGLCGVALGASVPVAALARRRA